ncbi:MAG: hypothetical protein ACOC36_07615 [Fibrobacterota bacterium]
MKLTLIFTFFLTVGLLQAKEYTVKRDLTANIYNEFLKTLTEQEMRLQYDTELGTFLWYVDYMMFPIAVRFTDTVRHELYRQIQKYKEWNMHASRRGVELDKEIGRLPPTEVYFKYGDSWEKDSRCTIRIQFFSQNTQRHQLVVIFETLQSDYNEFITHSPDALYFWRTEVTSFEAAISDEAVRQYMEEVQRQQSIEEEFE